MAIVIAFTSLDGVSIYGAEKGAVGSVLNAEAVKTTEATLRDAEVTDKNAALQLSADYKVLNGVATVTVKASSGSGIKSIKYLKGEYNSTKLKKWKNATKITKKKSFTTEEDGIYTIMAEDKSGKRMLCHVKVRREFRAAWIAYYDFEKSRTMGAEDFRSFVCTMFDNCVDKGMNAVVVHVRPFSDAMYNSKYYPWSVYASGKQGVNPGYDPLEIMVEEAHARELELHAWLNPYRVTSSGTDVKVLAENNPARVWLTDEDSSNDRNVLIYSGKIYYNPSKKAVQNLIVNGIREIVENYDVDGIHFDDYFYPEYLGSSYKTVFDGQEYQEYVEKQEAKGKTPMDIIDWRRDNVNTLVKSIYSAIKEIDETVEFGISPGGYIDHLLEPDRNYVDFPTWLSEEGYIDYICPQLYWSFDKSYNTFPYDTTLLRWIDYREVSTVKVYVGVAVYKCTTRNTGSTAVDEAWEDEYILAEQIKYARETGNVDGFIFFDYRDLINSLDRYQVANMTAELEGTLVWPVTEPLEEMGVFEWAEGERPDYPWIIDDEDLQDASEAGIGSSEGNDRGTSDQGNEITDDNGQGTPNTGNETGDNGEGQGTDEKDSDVILTPNNLVNDIDVDVAKEYWAER